MKNTPCRIHSLVSIMIVLVASLFVQACIDERYDLNRGISTAITFGGDSLAVPLGKTDTVRLEDFLDPADIEMIKTMEDGGYALTVNDSISVEIPKIDRSNLSLAEQSFNKQQTVDFGEISLKDFSIPGISVNSQANFSISQISLGNFGLPSVDQNLNFGAGMSGYTLTDLKFDDIDKHGSTGTIFTDLNLPSYSGSESIPLPITDEREVTVAYDQDIDFSVTVPSGVTEISHVTLKDNPLAEFEISVQVVGATGVLTTGKIVPDLTINPSNLFNFTDLPSGQITFEAKDSMTVNNQFTISRTCHFDGLNISGEPVNKVISKSSQVETEGSVHMEGVYVLSNKINDVKYMNVRVSVSINGMIIESMDLKVAPVYSEISGNAVLNINNAIPADIEKVNTVYFDEDSHSLSFSLQANNMPSGVNANLNLDLLTINFPSEFKLKKTEGLSGNTFTLQNKPFTNGFNKTFELDSLDLSQLEANGTLSWNSSITYSGQVSITFPDMINSSKIPSSGNDPKVNMNVQSDLVFESAEIVTKNKDIIVPDLDVPITFNINIAKQIKRLDTINMAENTKIRLHITKPDLPLELAGNPLIITFPPLFSFEEFLLNNTITFSVNDEIPELIELTLKSLNINKKLEEGKLVLDTVIQVAGSVRLKAGAVNTKDVESLSNEALDLLATTDDLKISSTSVMMNALSNTFNDSTVLDLDPIVLPEEIVSLDSILLSSDAKLELNIDLANMPKIDKPILAHIELNFPSLLGFVPGEADPNNKVVIDQAFDQNGKLRKTLNLRGLFFDRKDLNGMLTINEILRYNVGVEVDETTVNSEDLNDDPITVNVDVKLSGINFESVFGKLNPGIPPQEQNVPISGLPSFMQKDDVTLDITKPVITFETTCNLGIPIFIDLDLKPSREGVVMNDAVQQVRIRLPKAQTPDEPKNTHYWIAPDSLGKPKNYVFVEANIQKLFKTIPDDIQININASADKSEQHYINLLADYSMDVKYDVTVPFAFGEDLNIAYKDTITGLDPMIGESALSGKSLELLGSFQNSIPLELELELIPLDKDNIPLDVVPARQTINAGAKDGSPTTSNLTIKLNDPDGELKKLRGFELAYRASSNSTVAGTPIRPDNFIIAELKARLNGGITLGGNTN